MSGRHVAVAGTGRMGRDIGLWCLAHGFDVTWLSRDAGRLEAFRARSARDLRRLASGDAAPGNTTFATVADATFSEPPEVLLEAIEEDAAAKHALLADLVPRVGPRTLVLSTSSSLLPSMLHPRCLGAHFFHPIVLTGFVEAVVPTGVEPDAMAQLQAWLGDLGLVVLPQDERTAFSVNRLLLPLQNECFRLLAIGASPDAIEAAVEPVLGTGLLAFMDAVGLDVTASAVAAYRSRMCARDAVDLLALADGLERLLAAGKRGRKNGDGLLCGAPLPWAPMDDAVPADAAHDLGALFRLTCRRAIVLRDLDAAGMQVALTALFGVQYAPGGDTVNDDAIGAARFASTGLSYWRPGTGAEGQDS